MKLTSFPLAYRIGLAVGVPVVALMLMGATLIFSNIQSLSQLDDLESGVNFNVAASELIHELQRERGRSAGYVGGGGQASGFTNQLRQQRTLTDSALSRYRQAEASFLRDTNLPDESLSYIRAASQKLDALNAHRTRIDPANLTLPETVGPYTAIINDLLWSLGKLSKSVTDGETNKTLIGMLNLMHAKEAAGIERAVGSNILSSQDPTRAKHQLLISLYAKQQAYFTEFRELMEPQWSQALQDIENGADAEAVNHVRSVLINSGYGDSLGSYTGPQWFQLTTVRIDQLMGLEAQIANLVRERVASLKQSRMQSTLIIGAIVSVVLILSTIVASYIALSVIRPVTRVAKDLERLSAGQTDINLAGLERGDEIGVLTRAAAAFREATLQREAAIQQRTDVERQALAKRRQVLAQMAEQVESATKNTVGEVCETAETLKTHSQDVNQTLSQAQARADEVNSATRDTLDKTERAADLANQITSAIGEVTEQISRGDELAKDAVSKAAASRESVQSLEQAAHQIGDFIQIISGLSEQTNLLALNATIEAARAGEAGKGFAVVASEVKALAAQTSKSTTEITERVQQIQENTKHAVETISAIANAIDSLGEVTSVVAAAMEEQRASSDSFAAFIQDNKSSLEQVANQVRDLAELAQSAAANAGEMNRMADMMAMTSEAASDEIPMIVQMAIQDSEQRDGERFPVSGETHIEGHGPTKLVNVSKGGMRVAKPLDPAQDLKIKHDHGEHEGEVVWSNDQESGVRFKEPMEYEDLQKLVSGHNQSSAA